MRGIRAIAGIALWMAFVTVGAVAAQPPGPPAGGPVAPPPPPALGGPVLIMPSAPPGVGPTTSPPSPAPAVPDPVPSSVPPSNPPIQPILPPTPGPTVPVDPNPSQPGLGGAAVKPGTPPAHEPLPGEDPNPRPTAQPNPVRPPLPAEVPEPSQTPENPVGRQEPALSLEWVGPPTAKVNQPTAYALVVRNTGATAVQLVLVRVRIPNGVNVAMTEPRATTEGNVLAWDLGTLAARQEKVLQIRLVAEARGDVLPQAWVTFTGSSVMRIRVREPKLALKATAADKVLVGDAATISLTVTNPGDGNAEQVKVHAVLSDGLEHARGKDVPFDVGTLAAGESRTVQVICGTRGSGPQRCEGIAEAEGGLSARDVVSVNLIAPHLELQTVGPSLRYLGRKAVYTFKITNTGDAAATNVTAHDIVPDGFKVCAASDGGRYDFASRTVSWFVGEVGPGQTRQVQLEVQAINAGAHKHKISTVGARGLRAESELETRVEGLSAIMMEVVDQDDPIEVNGEEVYEIRVTNTGSKPETDIRLVVTIPDKMEFKSADGPVRPTVQGKTVTFEPIKGLAPRADAIIKVHARALEPGSVRFRVQLTSGSLTEPVTKEESTHIYSDAPELPAASTPGK